MPAKDAPKTTYKVARLFLDNEEGMTFSPFEDPLGTRDGDSANSRPRIITDEKEAFALADARVRATGNPYGIFACIDIRRPNFHVTGQLTEDTLNRDSAVSQFKPSMRKA